MKNKIKISLLLLGLMLTPTLASCDGFSMFLPSFPVDGTNDVEDTKKPDAIDPDFKPEPNPEIPDIDIIKNQNILIFKMATNSGYSGSFDKWIDDIINDRVLLRYNDGIIDWCYSSDMLWRKLVDLNDGIDSGFTDPYHYFKEKYKYTDTINQFCKDIATGRITFDLSLVIYSFDNTISMQIVEKNLPIVKRPNDPTKAGYKFLYWESNGSEFDFTKPVTDNIIYLSPRFEEIENYSVAINYDNNMMNEVLSVIPGESINLPDPVKDGFVFNTWINSETKEEITMPYTPTGNTYIMATYKLGDADSKLDNALDMTFDEIFYSGFSLVNGINGVNITYSTTSEYLDCTPEGSFMLKNLDKDLVYAEITATASYGGLTKSKTFTIKLGLAPVITIHDALALPKNENCSVEGRIMAVGSKNAIIYDGNDYITLYGNINLQVGKCYKVSGMKSHYYATPQIRTVNAIELQSLNIGIDQAVDMYEGLLNDLNKPEATVKKIIAEGFLIRRGSNSADLLISNMPYSIVLRGVDVLPENLFNSKVKVECYANGTNNSEPKLYAVITENIMQVPEEQSERVDCTANQIYLAINDSYSSETSVIIKNLLDVDIEFDLEPSTRVFSTMARNALKITPVPGENITEQVRIILRDGQIEKIIVVTINVIGIK